MIEVTRRRIHIDGIFGGLFAGGVFAAVETLIAAASGSPPDVPWNLVVTAFFGREVIGEGYNAGYFLLGMLFHFALAALFGLIFGVFAARLPKKARDSYATQSALGVAFGLVLWAVNIAWLARAFFPWSGAAGMLGPQLAVHLFAFGLPLGWFLCLRVRDYEVPGVHRARHKLQDADGGPEEVEGFRRDMKENRKELHRTPDERG